MRKKRAYLAKPSSISGVRFQASLLELALLLGMGAGGGPWVPQATGLMPAALGRRGLKAPDATQAMGPNPVPTSSLYHLIVIHLVCPLEAFSLVG